MPLNINVGLSRKASKDYQSVGVSINVTAELDSALLQKPAELSAQIDALYRQAENAIDHQVKAYGADVTSPTSPRANGQNANNGSGAEHTSNGNSRRNGVGMTNSQRRAILAIAERANLDAAQEVHDLFGVTLDDLTIRQASGFIDHLKEQAPARNGHG